MGIINKTISSFKDKLNMRMVHDNINIFKDKFDEALFELITDSYQKKIQKLSIDENRPSIDETQNIINAYVISCNELNDNIMNISDIFPPKFAWLTKVLTAFLEVPFMLSKQVDMIAELVIVHKKEKSVPKELVLYILFEGTGSKHSNFVTINSNQVIVKQLRGRVIHKVISCFGRQIFQILFSLAGSKFIPQKINTIAMSTWKNSVTKKVGKVAVHILSKNIVMEGEMNEKELDDFDSKTIDDVIDKASNVNPLQEIKKIKTLIKVAQADGIISNSEKERYVEYIENLGLSRDMKNDLIASLTMEKNFDLILPIFSSEDEKVTFMIQLIAMAKCDDNFSQSEKDILLEIGKKMGWDDDDVNALL